MKLLLLAGALVISFSAQASESVVRKLDSLYQQMDVVRQTQDRSRLQTLRNATETLNQQVSRGRGDTGCFDAVGMLRAMPVNIEFQWEALDQAGLQRHLKFWNELNTKYRLYASQCASASR